MSNLKFIIMNSLRNRVQLIGNLGNDPEVKELGNDRTLVKFSMATSESYKDSKGNIVKDTQWHNITAWGSTAKNMAKLLKKGQQIAVEGKLSNNNYEDKNGIKRYVTEIIVSEFVLMQTKQ